MQKYIFLTSLFSLLLLGQSNFAKSDAPIEIKPSSYEEALFLRRIVDFWEEGEHVIVKKQILKFLKTYPNTLFSQHLLAVLGDLYIDEKNYQMAAAVYGRITQAEIKEKVAINLTQCLHNLKKYRELSRHCIYLLKKKTNISKKTKQQIVFLLADSFYQRALIAKERKERIALADKAKYCFTKLLDTSLESKIAPYLCHIQALLGDKKASAEEYLALSEKTSDEEERANYLFQAAHIFSEIDLEKALTLFEKLAKEGKYLEDKAIYNRLILLFENKRYELVIDAKDDVKKITDAEQRESLQLLVSQSYFFQKQYALVISELREFLSKELNDKKHKEALLMIMHSAKELDDLPLMNQSFSLFQKFFAGDEDIPHFLFAKALLAKKQKQFTEAKKAFQEIKEKYPNFSNQSGLQFHLAHLLFEMKEFEKSRQAFYLFIQFFEADELYSSAWRYLLDASIASTTGQHGTQKTKELKARLIDDLNFALKQKDISQEEKSSLWFLLAKTRYEQKQYQLALEDLLSIIEEFPSSKDLGQIHLLQAYCYKEKNQDFEQFCHFGEKALPLLNSFDEKKDLHFSLFNAYVDLSSKERDKKQKWLDFAANHLFQAYEFKESKISLNNFLWLVEYYYSQVDTYMKESWKRELCKDPKFLFMADRAKQILENQILPLLEDANAENLLKIEPYLFKLSNLYSWQKEENEKKQILEKISFLYEKFPKIDWEYQDLVFLDLSKCYEAIREPQKAIAICDKIKKQKKGYYSLAATLHKTRLCLSIISPAKWNMQNKEVVDLLAHLKNIRLQKDLENEPLHLEAALDYVDIRSSLEEGIHSWKKRYSLLKRMREDFLSREDILSREYHAKRKCLSDKETIFQAYMKMMDIELTLCKVKLETDPEIREKNREYLTKLLKEIDEQNLLVTRYLQKRYENNIFFLNTKDNS